MSRLERPLPVEGQPARITELWAWTAIDPLTGVEGILGAKLPGGGGLPMVTTMRAVAERMRPHVEAVIGEAQDPRPVAQLRRFVAAEESE